MPLKRRKVLRALVGLMAVTVIFNESHKGPAPPRTTVDDEHPTTDAGNVGHSTPLVPGETSASVFSF
jgi:hypothetical protein